MEASDEIFNESEHLSLMTTSRPPGDERHSTYIVFNARAPPSALSQDAAELDSYKVGRGIEELAARVA